MSKNKTITSVYYLISLIWECNKRLVIFRFFTIFLNAVLPLGFLYLIKILADRILEATNIHLGIISSFELLGGILLFLLLIRAFDSMSAYVKEVHKHEFTDYLSVKIQKKSLYLDYENFDNEDFKNIIFNIQRTGINSSAQMFDFVGGIAQHLVSLSFLFLFFVSYRWWVPLLFIVPGLTSLLANKMFVGRMAKWEDENMTIARKSNFINYIIMDKAYNPENRIYGIGHSFISLFQRLKKDVFEQKKKLFLYKIKINIPVTITAVTVAAVFLYILLADAIAGVISIGAVVMYIQGLQRGIQAGDGLAGSAGGLQGSLMFIEQLSTYLKLENKPRAVKAFLPSDIRSISVKNVSFLYPDTKKLVLENLNINFTKGSITGIVGVNGSGKSTLIKLLTALYKPSCGNIYVNNNFSYKDIEQARLWQELSIVYQDFMSYPHSLTLSVTGKLELEHETSKILEVLRIAGLENLFEKNGDVSLGRHFGDGIELSMGQWQRIALARAIYRNAQILILDEPTSFVDGVSEKKFFRYLEKVKKEKIVIIISHKLSNLYICDEVLLLKNGQIIDKGTAERLLEKNEDFAGLFLNQC